MKRCIKRNAEAVKKENGYILYKMNRGSAEYYIYFISKRLSKFHNIYLKEDGTVETEYMYLFGGYSTPSRVRKVLCKPVPDGKHINFVIYKGTTNNVFGLDNGVFTSRLSELQTGFIYFLSAEEFCKISD